MTKIIEYFLDRKFLVDLISLMILVVGGFIAWNLKRDLIPQFQAQTISIGISIPGASAFDIEKSVAQPAEGVLFDLPFVKEMRSTSYNGYCEISIEYPDGFKKINDQVNEIRNRLSGLIYRLPPDTREPTIQVRQNTSAWFFSVAVIGLDPANLKHRETVQKFKDRILAIPGVVNANEDLARAEFLIRLDPLKLEEHGLRISSVAQAIREEILGIPVTNLSVSGDSIAVEISGRSNSPFDFEKLVLKKSEFGPTLYLKDIAKTETYIQPYSGVKLIGDKAFANLWFRKALGVDIIQIQKEADIALAEFQKDNLPPGLDFKKTGDGASFVQQQLKVLYSNSWVGALLVLLILGFFLGNKAALMALFGIPISYLGTALVLEYLGININLISVIALILILGVLVDDAIIITERYSELLREGKTRREAALKAATSMLGPVSAGITTTMIAFAPILLVGGWLTNVLFSIPIVIISALAVSWLEAFFILPNHLFHYVDKVSPSRTGFFKFKNFYKKLLGLTLRFRYLALIGVGLIVSATLWVATQKLKSNFDFNIGNRSVRVVATLKESLDYASTQKQLEPLSKHFQTIKAEMGVDEVYFETGRVWTDGKLKKGPRYAAFDLDFNSDNPEGQKLEAALIARLKKELDSFKTPNFERLTAQTSLEGSDGSDELENMYTIYFKGNQPLGYAAIVDLVTKNTQNLPGFVAVSFENDALGESLKFDPNAEALGAQGISERDLASGLRLGLNREDLGQIFWQGESFPVSLTTAYPLNELKSEQVPKDGLIQNSLGHFIPLSLLGSWKREKTQNQWFRKDGKRLFSVNIKYDETKVRQEDFKNSVTNILPSLKESFAGYEITLEEANKQTKENKAWILKSLLYCLGGIFFVLALQLQSFVQPLFISTSIIYGFMGVIWAFYFHGYKLEILGMVGLLGVAGISVNDSVILMDQINHLRKAGVGKWESLIEGASSRLQAIFLTSATTLAGLFPMAYGVGGDSGFTQPLAFSMAWGLLTASLMTLFFIPTLVLVSDDFKKAAKSAVTKIPKILHRKFRSKRNTETVPHPA
jgi:multidrug efflux pump subunit AcrB